MPTLIKKFPWLSWILFLLVYALFGWLVASEEFSWTQGLFKQLNQWGVDNILTEKKSLVRIVIVALLEILFISLITFLFSDFLTLLKSIWKTSFASNFLTFIYILFWSFMVSVIISWISYFIRLFVLLAAALLLRTDMNRSNFHYLHHSTVISLSGIVAFVLGLLAFKTWGVHFQSI